MKIQEIADEKIEQDRVWIRSCARKSRMLKKNKKIRERKFGKKRGGR